MACFSAPTAKIVNTQGSGQVSVPRGYNPTPVTKHNPIPSSSSSSSSISLIIPPLILGRRGRVSASSSGRVVVRGAGGESMAAASEKLGIKIVNNPPESKLSDLGVRSWPKWGCPPSKFPWTYSDKETCYLLKGKVKVYPEGSDEAVEFGAGDLVEFPKGMSCTWDVSEAVDKHYKFE